MQVETTPANFGRIAAQTAKQVVMQRIREAERDRVFIEYIDRVGDIINGVVQRHRAARPHPPRRPGAIILEFGKAEAVLPPSEQVKRERYRVGQRMRVLLLDVQRNQRGPAIGGRRGHHNMLRRLLELEVPEISQRHGGDQGHRPRSRAPARRSPSPRGKRASTRSAPASGCAASASRTSSTSCTARRSTSWPGTPICRCSSPTRSARRRWSASNCWTTTRPRR